MSNYVAAIDLGTTKVITIVGEKTVAGVKIIAYAETPSEGVMRGEVVNIQKVLNSLLPSVASARQQIEDTGYTLNDVYVGIAGQNIRCDSGSIKRQRSNPTALITKDETNSMLEEMYNSRVAPGEQVLHVIPQSYNVDEHMEISEPEGMEGKEIDGNYRLFYGRVNSATHSQSVITRSGLHLKKLILEPIASARALLTDDEKELGVAMVDIGGGTTDLLIYFDNTIRHTAVIPFGGNSITEDIRQICGVSLKNAEGLKKVHGSCISEYAQDGKTIAIKGKDGEITKEIPFKLLSEAIEARVSEIIASVLYEIEKSTYKDKIKKGIVLTGGTSNLNHISSLTKQITGYDVRIAFPNENVIMPNSVEDIYKPGASTAVGLVLKGFDIEAGLEEEKIASKEQPLTDIFGRAVSEESTKSKNTPNRTPKANRKGMKERLGGMIDNLFAMPEDDA